MERKQPPGKPANPAKTIDRPSDRGPLPDAALDRATGGAIKADPSKYLNPDGTTNKAN
jgi:hypothetical protein